MNPRHTIGVDLGGTKLTAGLVDGRGSILSVHRWPERVSTYESALEAIEALVGRLQGEAGDGRGESVAVGVAAAAFLDAERTRILHAANLGWRDKGLRADLEERLQVPVVLANDADAAAWGEYLHGARPNCASLALITVGTGVGCGLVINGQLVTGAHGLGGELGHVPLVADGRACACGGRGCLEQYASGAALRRAAQLGVGARPGGARRLLELAGGDLDAIDGAQILAAAGDADEVARGAFEEVGRWLGIGVAYVVALLDPDIVLLGGGLTAAGAFLLDPACSAYARHRGLSAVGPAPPLAIAHLGPHAGIVGAAALARDVSKALLAVDRDCSKSSVSVDERVRT